MKSLKCAGIATIGLAFAAIAPAGESLPDPAEVTGAMRKAASFFRSNLSVAGGYASSWPLDLSEGRTEHRASPTVIEIQPPGTPSVGLAMLRAYHATGEELFRQGAREAASALMWCQLASGGWTSDFDFAPSFARRYHFRRDVEAGDGERGKRNAMSTLDDNKTQGALMLLVEWQAAGGVLPEPELRRSLDFGFAGLLAAQETNGGWPQQFDGPSDPGRPVKKATLPADWPREWPKDRYAGFYTLNDNNILRTVRVLLRAGEVLDEERYREAAIRAGDFLLLAQLEEPQPGWAQQYDHAMQPVWARKFEPPALASVESMGAIETLFELWIATGEKRFRDALPPALDWLERSRLPDGKWARFYELRTNRALYCEADTYELTYDDSDLPDHYGFQIDERFGRKIERMRDLIARSRDDLMADREPPSSPAAWAREATRRAGRAREAMEKQDPRGYWTDGDSISARRFVEHLTEMAAYVEASRKGNP